MHTVMWTFKVPAGTSKAQLIETINATAHTHEGIPGLIRKQRKAVLGHRVRVRGGGLCCASKGPGYVSSAGKRGPSITLKTYFKCSAITIPFRRWISSTTRARHSTWQA
jgi:hypothetical protein